MRSVKGDMNAAMNAKSGAPAKVASKHVPVAKGLASNNGVPVQTVRSRRGPAKMNTTKAGT